MSDKPVAWMSQGGDVSRSADYFVEMGFTDLIPLYTHPVKELTDEEIEEFEWMLKKHFHFHPTEIVPNLDRIIKAIARKAQEK